MNEEATVRTGIEGLDQILLGGIPRANVIVVRGETGTGKTLFGMEFTGESFNSMNPESSWFLRRARKN
jgi:KaiC/GvpD/RAD55 family RecA-like ATPase